MATLHAVHLVRFATFAIQMFWADDSNVLGGTNAKKSSTGPSFKNAANAKTPVGSVPKSIVGSNLAGAKLGSVLTGNGKIVRAIVNNGIPYYPKNNADPPATKGALMSSLSTDKWIPTLASRPIEANVKNTSIVGPSRAYPKQNMVPDVIEHLLSDLNEDDLTLEDFELNPSETDESPAIANAFEDADDVLSSRDLLPLDLDLNDLVGPEDSSYRAVDPEPGTKGPVAFKVPEPSSTVANSTDIDAIIGNILDTLPPVDEEDDAPKEVDVELLLSNIDAVLDPEIKSAIPGKIKGGPPLPAPGSKKFRESDQWTTAEKQMLETFQANRHIFANVEVQAPVYTVLYLVEAILKNPKIFLANPPGKLGGHIEHVVAFHRAQQWVVSNYRPITWLRSQVMRPVTAFERALDGVISALRPARYVEAVTPEGAAVLANDAKGGPSGDAEDGLLVDAALSHPLRRYLVNRLAVLSAFEREGVTVRDSRLHDYAAELMCGMLDYLGDMVRPLARLRVDAATELMAPMGMLIRILEAGIGAKPNKEWLEQQVQRYAASGKHAFESNEAEIGRFAWYKWRA